ncbi:MAG: DUF5686 and carboxypeptidase regulatory-like domain-containing protein [Prevotellaceae bacterium]|jgi:hypothetical protein|nr:DUF5686 and carboxypeptidase regulatory-like domain-containing protein [Prevotellaceae bacterium]
MRFFKQHIFLVLALLAVFTQTAQTQTRTITGTLTDAANGEPLPFASVLLEPKTLDVHVYTDEKGRYSIQVPSRATDISYSYIGYISQTLSIPKGSIQNVKLKPETQQLEAAVVKAKRVRYRNKDNPAVELIRKVIDNKDNNRIESLNTYSYDKYEKLELDLNDLKDSIKNSTFFRQFPFFSKYIDTAKNTGTLSLPIYFRETISENYFRKSPKASKEIVVGQQMVNFHDFIENSTLNAFLDGLISRSDIYNNTITLLEVDFMSPLSPLSPNFYRFHIVDTIFVGDAQCINLHLYPRNDADYGFRGNMYITNDSLYAVKRIELGLTKNASVNLVRDFSMIQEYEMIDSTWCLNVDEVIIDFSLTDKKSMILGKRSNTYTNYKFNQRIPDGRFLGGAKVEPLPGFDMRAAEYWADARPISLLKSEQGMYDMVQEMKQDRKFSTLLNVVSIIFSGYINVGKFDIGTVEAMLSFNEVEGTRPRFGGKTNAFLHPKLFGEGFVAYGTKDKKFKYQVGAMYSFDLKKLHPWEYPMNLLSISYENNIETPGQYLRFGSPDRLLLSFHRGDAQQMVYHRTFRIKYEKEYLNGFALAPSFINRWESPIGMLKYIDDNGVDVNEITTTQVGLNISYAPSERFYQIQRNRFPLNHTNPVFSLSYTYGIKDFWESDYEFHRLELGIEKRTWLSSFGYTNISLRAGKIWKHVPFPLLVIHQANQNYAYQEEAYNMMNYMEFVSDQYASVNIAYHLNGWLFNRIPLLKKLKWREIITFKALWGSVSDRNLPQNNPSLLRFPVNEDGVPTMYALDDGPYMEASVGIENILKVLRLDLVRRISYLDNPDAPKWGVRFRMRFVF